ncbi:MAG: MBOAT family protein [Oscillospiraceae bacterium]|nr:MBOAT family protein [Oscillospiraceae bacterium]
MQFTSFSFLLFAAVLLTVYYIIPGKWQWPLLLIASCFFYISAGTEYLVFIALTTLSTYATTILMDNRLKQRDVYMAAHKAEMSREEKKAYKAKIKSGNKVWMVACLVLNFGILALCKACLIDPVRTAVSGGTLSFLTVGLPLGISFYMFQSMGYVVDVYRETAKTERNPFKLALFVSFFPQLIQGPISKFNQLTPTLYAPHKFDGKAVSFGLQRMLWGYFKKLVVADRIAVAIGSLKGEEYTGIAFLVLTVFYAIQIYGDFTGGIDVTIGLAEAMGIKLPENFIRPYFSKNIAEYWRRWHISLGVWMKDCIFYPISVSEPMRKLSKASRAKFPNFGKRVPVYVASVATWFCTGIWHGFSANFIVWGMLNCFVIVVSEELMPVYAKFHDRFHLKEKKWYGGFEILRMFMLMNLIRACDLFPNVGDYFRRLGSIVTTFNFHILWDGTLMNIGLTALDYAIIFGGCLTWFVMDLLQEKGPIRERLYAKPAALRYSLIFILLVVVLLMGSYGIGYDASNFIYNQF